MPDYPEEDCYETLGVDPDASQDVIEKTWKRLNKVYHPDVLGSVAARDRLAAEQKLKKINAAYECLKDPDRRRRYDQWNRQRREPPNPSVAPRSLDFGTLKPGESRTKRLTVENEGGPVTGEINFSLEKDPSHFVLAVDASNGFPILVDITFDGSDSFTDEDFLDSFTVTLDGVSAPIPLLSRVRSAPTITPPPIPKATYTPSPKSAPPPPSPGGGATTPTVAKPGLSRAWDIALGCIAGFMFQRVAGPAAAMVISSIQPHLPAWLGACLVVWLYAVTILVGIAVIGILRRKRQRAGKAAVFAIGLTLTLALLVALAALGAQHQSILPPTSSIHSVRFRELSYRVGPPYCKYFGNSATVHNGKFSNNEASFQVSKVEYDDLTHEGGQQAVVVADCLPNNAANPGADVSFVYIYSLRNGQPVLLATFVDGLPWNYQGWTQETERADGMILWNVTRIHVEAGMLSFERFGGHARCCPEINLKRTFRWSNGRFVLAGETQTPWKEQSSLIPSAIKKALDDEYPGWHFQEVASEDLETCRQPNPDFLPGLVWGDFDGDGARDYGVAVQQGGKSHTLAFLARGSAFARFVLQPGGWNILGVGRKGETLPQVGEDSNGYLVGKEPITLQNDALLAIGCGKSSVAFVYANGTFQHFFMSD